MVIGPRNSHSVTYKYKRLALTGKTPWRGLRQLNERVEE